VDDSEFQAILDHEEGHWWYRGRLRIILDEVERLAPLPGATILDAGCGSGRVMKELGRFGDVVGADVNPAAVAASRARRAGRVVEASVDELPFPDESFSLVTCLDVIEHTPDDVATMRELRRVTAPGGHMLVTVPAYPALWSTHDEVNEHYRRYRRRSLRDAAARAGWELDRDGHFNSLLLAPAAAVRLASRLLRGATASRDNSELALTPRALDSLLELPLRLEAALVRSGVNLPAGLSLIATFRKPVEARLAYVRPLRRVRRNAPSVAH
jgi:SAM-dependent methyltransferase